MNQELMQALEELELTKDIKKEYMIEAIKAALVAACKKNYLENLYVRVEMNEETGAIQAYTQKMVAEEVEDPVNEISLEEARAIKPSYEVGDFVDYAVDPMRFGRIAAQTAKQVVIQKIREAERGHLFDAFSEKEGKILTGVIQKEDRKGIIVSLEDNAEGLLVQKEQIPGEEYPFNKRMKFFVMEIKKAYAGPQILLSRTHPGLIRKLFEQEVPEIAEGTVEIKSVIREAGSRTKMAVWSKDEKIDPIGSCVGQKGMRVNAVMDGMGDEKIDIIKYSEDPAEFIKAALSPAKVTSVTINEEEKSAMVLVPEYQLSLAIGKEGQNVRIAARLTGWKIDIKSDSAE
ncbi:MAG: transcription termination/antitermination protein NusA [Clostridia bacterium]|nr:transcription termination/antitermination protein NusA [Clostridia bacterium]